MRRILTVAILICLVALAVLYPAIESLDRWDAPGPFSDSEIQVIAVLTLVGVMFVLARLLVTLVLSFLRRLVPYLSRSSQQRIELGFLRFAPSGTASPPLILRM